MNPKALKLETTVKWIGGIGVVIIIGGVAVAVMTSIVAIAATAVVGLAVVNGMPVIARKFASWKYNALRQDAIDNPVPNLLTKFQEAEKRYKMQYQGVVTLSATTKNFQSKITQYKSEGAPTEAMQVMYENMKRALSMKTQALGKAKDDLEDDRLKIKQVQQLYNMALDMQSANAMLEQSVEVPMETQMLAAEALQSITTKLNTGFAGMEVAMALDYNSLPQEMINAPTMRLEEISSQLHALEVK